MIKRDVCDDLFSKLVRERAGWCCESCGKYYPEGNRMGLHCSHYFGRRYKGTRFHPDNAWSHCYGCHSKFEGDPYMFTKWVTERLGAWMVEILREKAYAVTKLKPADMADMAKHFRAELKRLESLRKAGEVGRLEFAAWS